MLHAVPMHQGPDLPKLFADGLVGIKNKLAVKKFDILSEAAPVINRRINIQPIEQPHIVVLAAMAGSGMHAAGTGIQGYMGAQNKQRVPRIQRMNAVLFFKVLRIDAAQDGKIRNAEGLHAGVHQFPGQDVNLVATDIDGDIFEIRVQRNGQVRRNGPGRGGPDENKNLFAGQLRQPAAQIVL